MSREVDVPTEAMDLYNEYVKGKCYFKGLDKISESVKSLMPEVMNVIWQL